MIDKTAEEQLEVIEGLLNEYLAITLDSESAREVQARAFVDELLRRYAAEDDLDGP